jgi:hypothetical protein
MAQDPKRARPIAELPGGLRGGKLSHEISAERLVLPLSGVRRLEEEAPISSYRIYPSYSPISAYHIILRRKQKKEVRSDNAPIHKDYGHLRRWLQTPSIEPQACLELIYVFSQRTIDNSSRSKTRPRGVWKGFVRMRC